MIKPNPTYSHSLRIISPNYKYEFLFNSGEMNYDVIAKHKIR
jgi:hypothetical protein